MSSYALSVVKSWNSRTILTRLNKSKKTLKWLKVILNHSVKKTDKMEIELLKKENTPENVIRHCKAVCRKSMKIAANFDDADTDLIRKGALLHDIGRSKTHGITHAIVGAEIAKNYGYSEDVLNIIERHIGAGISESEALKLGLPKKSYIPQTLEEKIVAHADNLVSGSAEVDIDFVIEKWQRNIEDSDDNIRRLIELDNELIKAFEE